jgi:hypothetical protein
MKNEKWKMKNGKGKWKEIPSSLRASRLATTPKLCQILPYEVEEYDDFGNTFFIRFFYI